MRTRAEAGAPVGRLATPEQLALPGRDHPLTDQTI